MAKKLWRDTVNDTLLWDSTAQTIFYSDTCCCNVGADCAGQCISGTTASEMDLTLSTIPVDVEICDTGSNCAWLEGQKLRLQQDSVDPCKYCITLDPWCSGGQKLEICFFFWFLGKGGPGLDATMGRLQFLNPLGSEVSQIEWEIGVAPINCSDYSETLNNSLTDLVYNSDAEQRCDWYGLFSGRTAWSYFIDAV